MFPFSKVMLISCRSTNVSTDLGMVIPVVAGRYLLITKGTATRVRWAWMGSLACWKMGRVLRSCSLMRKDHSACCSSWWRLIISAPGLMVLGMLVI